MKGWGMARPGLLEFVVYAMVLAIAAGWVYGLPPFTHEPWKPRFQIQAAAPSGSSEPAKPVSQIAPEATPSATPPVKLMVVTAKNLNMRSRPDARSELVGSYPRGALVEPVETSGNWVRVRTADDETGWMYAAYLGATDAE
jgi:uncharacterized protein YgiM (DUF1202 family)